MELGNFTILDVQRRQRNGQKKFAARAELLFY